MNNIFKRSKTKSYTPQGVDDYGNYMSIEDALRGLNLGLDDQLERVFSDPQSMSSPYGEYKRAYLTNDVVFESIGLLVRAMLNIPIDTKNKYLEVLLTNPNTYNNYPMLVETIIVSLMLDGNAYIRIHTRNNMTYTGNIQTVVALEFIEADRVHIEKDENTGEIIYLVNDVKIDPHNFIHIRTNNFGAIQGLPILSSAREAINLYNLVYQNNTLMLRNRAVPSGILSTETGDGRTLLEKDRKEIANHFKKMSVGNSLYEPIVLSNMKWIPMVLNNKDMEYITLLENARRSIANTVGISVILLDDRDNSTYNNLLEAKQHLYTNTVIPMFQNLINTINKSLNVNIEAQYNDIPTLQQARLENIKVIKDVQFLTENEKREIAGYKPVDGLDVFRVDIKYVDVEDEEYPEKVNNRDNTDTTEVQGDKNQAKERKRS